MKKCENGDKLICKKTADDKYYAEYLEKHTYKNRSAHNWIHPEKDTEYIIKEVWSFKYRTMEISDIKIENMLTSFQDDDPKLPYYIWDWFYTDKELRMNKLERLNEL